MAAAISRNKKNNIYSEHTHDKVDAQISQNVSQNFDTSDTECSQTDDNESLFSNIDNVMLSPSGHTSNITIVFFEICYVTKFKLCFLDAQTLAMVLQKQLDVINNEIRLIQKEKQNTEQRAEELESQVGSLDSMTLLSRAPRPYEQSHLIGISPSHSGRSTPNTSRVSPLLDHFTPLYPLVSLAKRSFTFKTLS